MMLGIADAGELMGDERLTIEGDVEALAQLAGLFDTFRRRFPIVTARPESPDENH